MDSVFFIRNQAGNHQKPPPQHKIEGVGGDLDLWTREALHAGARIGRASAAWSNAVAFLHPPSIGAAYEQIEEAKGEIDHLVSRALRPGPPRQLFAEAALEYRQQRGNALSVVPPRGSNGPPRPAPQHSIRETSEATTRERQRLRQAHPAAWSAGERAGLRNEPAPSEFARWSADARSAFFAASHVVALAKLRGSR